MELIVITESNYQDYLSLDIVAFSFAYPGAMGDPGAIIIIDRNGQIYYANYCNDNNYIKREHIKDIIPIFGGIKWWPIGCDSNNDEWVNVDLGMGNNLLMLKEISDDFHQQAKAANIKSQPELYHKWYVLVLSMLGKFDQYL